MSKYSVVLGFLNTQSFPLTYMVKSLHIEHGCVVFIGEKAEIWFKISLLHLVPGMPFSQWGVAVMEFQGSTPKVQRV